MITIAGESYVWTNYVTTVTPISGRYTPAVTSSNGKLVVILYDAAGNKTQAPFQFVTYKP